MADRSAFNYVVAYPWPESPNRLCIYAYGSEVQQGCSAEGAQWLLERANVYSPGKPWAIYRVDFTPISTPGVALPDGSQR